MAIKFENTPLEWANKGVEPTEEIKQSGFVIGYAPPAEYHNYLFANALDSVAELQEVASAADDSITDLKNNKVNKTQYASLSDYGVIKLYSSNGTNNNSGLVATNGVVYVCTKNGLYRGGDGSVNVDFANTSNIDSRTANKAIAASTLDYAVQAVTGQLAGLTTDEKATFTAAINWLNNYMSTVEDCSNNAENLAQEAIDKANIKKNPNATDGDIIDTHLTVGTRSTSLTSLIGANSISSGENNVASNKNCAVLGGSNNSAFHENSAVLGGQFNAAGGEFGVVLGGEVNNASGKYSVALGGTCNNALANQIKGGHYSKDGTAGTNSGTTGDAFALGNGTETAQSNCFRVDYAGSVYGMASYKGGGADYAEYFEWLDGNPNGTDRRGIFVTLDGEKIRPATIDDDYILGVVSALPSICGDTHSEVWQGMYKRDVFGAYEKDADGNMIISPDYDNSKEYVSREYRPEWAAVGMLGKLVVCDDGTCQPNGYCTAGESGIATAADTGYRVLSRIDDTHVKILVK